MIVREPGGQLWNVNNYLRSPPFRSSPSVSSSERKMVPLVEGNWLQKFLRNAGFCLPARIWGNRVSTGPNSLH